MAVNGESLQQPYAHGYDSALTTRWHAARTAEN